MRGAVTDRLELGSTVESTLMNSSSFEFTLLLRENSKEEEVSPEKLPASRSHSNRYSLYYVNFRSCDDALPFLRLPLKGVLHGKMELDFIC